MTCADTKKYLEEFLPLIEEIPNDRKIVIAPPFTAISTFF
jgi:triosephosphate isomerase